MALVVKNPPANAGDMRYSGLIPGLGGSPGESHGNPLQYSCLENPIERGAWWAMVHRFAKSQTRVKQLSMQKEINSDYIYLKKSYKFHIVVSILLFFF